MNDVLLYHGSRGGIEGDIKPVSRKRCDFGSGFYMGTNPIQAKTLVANDSVPVFYQMRFKLSEISEKDILQLRGMAWAFFVLYNRGKLNNIKDSDLYKSLRELEKDKSVIIGPIADDALSETMNRFVENLITDVAFLKSIESMNYGMQYVAKTEEACRYIDIESEKVLSGFELTEMLIRSAENRDKGLKIAEESQRAHRREGLYFDEIVEKYRNIQIRR